METYPVQIYRFTREEFCAALGIPLPDYTGVHVRCQYDMDIEVTVIPPGD